MTDNYNRFAASRAQDFASQKNFLHAYIEKPTMYALLPDVSGKQVLCIGCGTGEECAKLQEKGAIAAGFDSSNKSITYAQQHVKDVSFFVADMDDPATYDSFVAGTFDLVYASMAFHYSNNFQLLLQNAHRLLKPSGQLLFSVGHPLRWATEFSRKQGVTTSLMGYERHADEVKIWGNYLETQQFTQQLSDGPEVTYWMRPVSSYFDLLTQAGFSIRAFKEPSPLPKAKAADPILYKLRSKLPVVMIFLAQKN